MRIEQDQPEYGTLEKEVSERAAASARLQQWSQPLAFDMEDSDQQVDFRDFLKDNPSVYVIDPLDSIQSSLSRLDEVDSIRTNEVVDANYSRPRYDYGTFFYFPWQDSVVRYPSKADHYRLMTARNQNIIYSEEQKRLGEAKIAVLGLSVGRSILSSMVRGGVGESVVMADPDTLEPTNLNRLSASIRHVGASKVDIAAQEVSEVNPFVNQKHLNEGIGVHDLQNMRREDTDILIDAVDDLSVKAHIRNAAERLGLPVLMATDVGGRVLIDIERYDLGGVKPFLGRISASEYDKLLSEDESSPDFRKKMLVKIVGIQNASARLLESLALFGKGELDGIPQLNTTVQAAGALATDAAVEVLLGRHNTSARYRLDKSKTIGARRNPDGFKHTVRAYKNLIKS